MIKIAERSMPLSIPQKPLKIIDGELRGNQSGNCPNFVLMPSPHWLEEEKKPNVSPNQFAIKCMMWWFLDGDVFVSSVLNYWVHS